jgi:hypothetical protein
VLVGCGVDRRYKWYSHEVISLEIALSEVKAL